MEKKKTLVLGATTNPGRYAYLAAHRLVAAGHDIVNIGIKNGESAGVEIQRAGAAFPDINTVTLYIGPQRQPEYYDYIMETRPKRIIFNPGTENPELEARSDKRRVGKECVRKCKSRGST